METHWQLKVTATGLLCGRDPWRRINVLNPVRSSDVGHRFYARYSRCLPESVPGKVGCNHFCLICVDLQKLDTPLVVFAQTCPLDLYTDCFYENRKEAIAARVQLLGEASVETLCGLMEDVWSSQEGKVCSLVSWERFSSLQQAQVFINMDLHCNRTMKYKRCYLYLCTHVRDANILSTYN